MHGDCREVGVTYSPKTKENKTIQRISLIIIIRATITRDRDYHTDKLIVGALNPS